MLKVYINTLPISAVLDTGAEFSVISKHLFDRIKSGRAKPVRHRLQRSTMTAANNTAVNVLGTLTADLRIGGLLIPHDFRIVNELSNECLIGMDFLNNCRAQIDLRHGVIDLYDGLTTVPLYSSGNYTVYTQRLTVIPPESEAIFPVIAPGVPRTDMILEGGASACRSLVIARSLVNTGKGMLCRVLNPLQTPIKLKAQSPIGYLSAIQEAYASDTIPPPSMKGKLPPIEIMKQQLAEKGVSFQDTAVTGDDFDSLIKLLFINMDIMATSLADLPGTTEIYHRIDTGDSPPIRQRQYRMGPEEKQEISRQTKEMLAAGVIEPSETAWSSPTLLVKKKSGDYRWVVDLRKLNSVTRMTSWPLPTLPEIFDTVAESKCTLWSSLDLHSGYWQVPLDPETAEKTGFQTHEGAFAFKRMPFGLTGAPITFQRLMQKVLRSMPVSSCLFYLDDVLLMGQNPQHMERVLQEVFNRFRAAKLRIKASKCSWSVNKILFLGHVFQPEGVSSDPKKLEIVRNYPRPTTVKGVKSFLGLAGYNRKFVRGFAQIASPLRQLLRKNQSFKWEQAQENSFQKLKDALCSEPVMLALPDLNKPFILTTDASTSAVSYILSQMTDKGERVVSYGGRSLRENESKWSITELECLAIIEGVKEYNVYLKAQPFSIVTDHVSLSYIHKMKLTGIGRLTRWAVFLQPYKFTVQYKKGALLTAADSLSRVYENGALRPASPSTKHDDVKPSSPEVNRLLIDRQKAGVCLNFVYLDEPSTIATLQSPMILPTLDKVKEELPNCSDFKNILSYLTHGCLPENDQAARRVVMEAKDFLLEDGVLYHLYTPRTHNLDRSATWVKQLCIPSSLRPAVAVALHDSNNHCGFDRTYATCRSRFFFPQMYKFLHDHIQTCETCQRIKRPYSGTAVPTIPMPVPRPLSRWVADLHGPFPASPAPGHSDKSCCLPNRYVLTVVDSSSMWPELIAVPDCTAETIFRALFDNVVSRIGLPRGIALQTDLGSAFISKLGALWAKTFGVRQYFSTPHHHSPNSRAENIAVVIHQSLKVLCAQQKDWSHHLSAVSMAYRATATSNLALSPHEVVFGRPMPMPIDHTLAAADPTVPSVDAFAEDIKVKLAVYEQIAMQNAKDSAFKRSQAVNSKATQPTFKNGDKVLLFDPTTRKAEAAKLKIRWVGPYFIIDCLPNLNYRLKHVANGTELKNPVHASRLRPLRELDNDYRLVGSGANVILFEAVTCQRNTTIQVKVGDITKTNCQVIVNPFNENKEPMNVLIANEIGPEIAVNFLNGENGEIVETEPGYLYPEVKKVYHVLFSNVERGLAKRFMNCLQRASQDLTVESIAFPIISGTDDWTLAQVCAEAIKSWDNSKTSDSESLSLIELVAINTVQADIYATVLREVLTEGTVPKIDDDKNLEPGIDLPISEANADSNDWYAIDRILKHRKRRSKDEYLVKWLETGATSWVRRENVSDGAIQEFYRNRKPQRKRRRNRY